MGVRNTATGLIRCASVQLYLFDLLHRAGQSLLRLPYTGHRDLPEDLGPAETRLGAPWYPGDGADVWAAHGLKGVGGKPWPRPAIPASAGIDQGQARPPPRGHRLRLETRPGPRR